MASFLLPQGMLAVTCNHSVQFRFPPLKNHLGFSSYRFTSQGNSFSNGSLNLNCDIFDSAFAVRSRISFVVRSENGSENVSVGNGENEGEVEVEAVVVEDSEENVESELGSEAEPEPEPEPRPPRKPRIKMGDIMGILNKKAVEASEELRPVPDIRTGDVVEIKLEVPENRRRLSVYKGIVISRQNAGIHTTIRIRRIIAGVGVEIVFPLYSPNIKEIKVVSHRKVRKARLYYLREKLPRLSTFK